MPYSVPGATEVAAALALLLASAVASAAPVTVAFDGTVSGVSGPALQILNDHPVGTAVSWQFAFDDAFLAFSIYDPAFTSLASQAVSGSVSVGADSYALDFARLASYSFQLDTGELNWFQFQVEGSGPASASGGDFFGLWVRFDPQMNLLDDAVGFGFSAQFFTAYGYLETEGIYRVTRNDVPLPSTAWLLLPGLAGLAATAQRSDRRRRRGLRPTA